MILTGGFWAGRTTDGERLPPSAFGPNATSPRTDFLLDLELFARAIYYEMLHLGGNVKSAFDVSCSIVMACGYHLDLFTPRCVATTR